MRRGSVLSGRTLAQSVRVPQRRADGIRYVKRQLRRRDLCDDAISLVRTRVRATTTTTIIGRSFRQATFLRQQRLFSTLAEPKAKDKSLEAPEPSEIYGPIERLVKDAHVQGLSEYRRLHQWSLNDPASFWGEQATRHLHWSRRFDEVVRATPKVDGGDVQWFAGGKLNAAYNCVDRHAHDRPNDCAIIWEGDGGEVRKLTFAELLRQVCRIANVLKAHGVRRGDTVVLYMPMIPETVATMLACARIGAIHSVVFAGFSAEALVSRINDCGARVVVTANAGVRGGRVVPLKETVDEALLRTRNVHTVLVSRYGKTEAGVAETWRADRDVWLEDEMERQRPYCAAEDMDAEDPLFVLYTSGSTGKPKGMLHTTAGYLLYAAVTHRLIFDYKPGDVYACVADVGWITGHSYVVYGPLANGATTLLFESLPTHPTPERYWQMIERHKIVSFYTAPTALRALMRHGDEPLEGYDRSTLRVLGTVGEPINPAAWEWYFRKVGNERCAIVDTYWQTETGGVIVSPLPGVTPMKPGSASLPFFGIDIAVLDPQTGERLNKTSGTPGERVSGVLAVANAWPGMARSVWNDHARYVDTYFNPYPGYFFSGDGCVLDEDGYVWITGRVDDVITKAGHRLGTAEIENALTHNVACAEAAVVAIPDELKGEAIMAFCTLAEGYRTMDPSVVRSELRHAVRASIGAIASPDFIVLTPTLPKTRSGKIMRRVLRKLGSGESLLQLGDVSTLADGPESLAYLEREVRVVREAGAGR